MENEKKVILSLEEYEKLKADSEALTLAKEELKKDCEERGYYINMNILLFHENRYDFYGTYYPSYNARFLDEKPPLNIISKDETLKLAQARIEELERHDKALLEETRELEAKIKELHNRSLFQRIFHKY